MDVHTKDQRSFNMSRIRSKETQPEIIVRKYLFSQGFRYRKNVRNLPGKPDIVLPKYRTIIFINGCFWHGHEGCSKFILPKTNAEFWSNKISTNKNRDQLNYTLLANLGWNVIVIWECQLSTSNCKDTLEALKARIINP
jgi:DNA mismatch endonuclease (patch repair protein)